MNSWKDSHVLWSALHEIYQEIFECSEDKHSQFMNSIQPWVYDFIRNSPGYNLLISESFHLKKGLKVSDLSFYYFPRYMFCPITYPFTSLRMKSLKKAIKNDSFFHWKIINIWRQNKHKNYVTVDTPHSRARRTNSSSSMHFGLHLKFCWDFFSFQLLDLNCALENFFSFNI